MIGKGSNPRKAALKVLALAALGCLACAAAHGLVHEGRVGEVAFTIYAPDWTWQKRDVNILIVLRNEGEATSDVFVDLARPEGASAENPFTYGPKALDAPDPLHVRIGPKETVRQAFTAINARNTVAGQTYLFAVVFNQYARVPYPLRVIRGEVVSPGRWALYLPAGIALIWSIVFVLVFRRMSTPRAWRIHGPPVTESESNEPWIDQQPS